MKGRAPNLRPSQIAEIVQMISVWRGPLKWNLLSAAIQKRFGPEYEYTRQSLSKHVSIQKEFSTRQQELREGGGANPTRKATTSPELELALDRIERLTSERDRLKRENDQLLEQFVLWAYNARTRGFEKFLNLPLPPVDRRPTRKKADSVPLHSRGNANG